jgi:hypothetical protein
LPGMTGAVRFSPTWPGVADSNNGLANTKMTVLSFVVDLRLALWLTPLTTNRTGARGDGLPLGRGTIRC